jgi:hypothetical protein
MFLSNSQVLIDAVHARAGGVSEFNVIVNNIRCILVSNCNFEIKFIQRQMNMVAHTLDRAVISYTSRRQVYDYVPPCIYSLLNNEMS